MREQERCWKLVRFTQAQILGELECVRAGIWLSGWADSATDTCLWEVMSEATGFVEVLDLPPQKLTRQGVRGKHLKVTSEQKKGDHL